MATYSRSSPYSNTQTWGPFLDVWKSVIIPPHATDAIYQIDQPYNLRPDILAYDMYKDVGLWWVFAVRNPDVLLDPLLDFTTNKIIYVPTQKVVQQAIGL
jgi:hypothetical protein